MQQDGLEDTGWGGWGRRGGGVERLKNRGLVDKPSPRKGAARGGRWAWVGTNWGRLGKAVVSPRRAQGAPPSPALGAADSGRGAQRQLPAHAGVGRASGAPSQVDLSISINSSPDVLRHLERLSTAKVGIKRVFLPTRTPVLRPADPSLALGLSRAVLGSGPTLFPRARGAVPSACSSSCHL